MRYSPSDNLISCCRAVGVFPIVLIALGISEYWACVFFDFVNYDDLTFVVENPFIDNLGLQALASIFSHFYIDSYYPVRLLSFAIDNALWGQNPGGYHATNFLLHLANMVLVYHVALQIALKSDIKTDTRQIAFLSAAFFGLHPVVVSVVAWIPGREEILVLFFGLLTLFCHFRAMESEKFRWKAGAGVFFTCSCLSNVTGAVLPAIVVGIDIVLYDERRVRRLFAHTWNLWLVALLTLLLKGLALLCWDTERQLLWYPYIPDAIRKINWLWAMQNGEMSEAMSLLERTRVIFCLFAQNVFRIVTPFRMPIVFPNIVPKSFLTVCPVVGLCIFGFFLHIFRKNRRNKLFVVSIFWFFIGLLPSAQIVPHHIMRADRFLYFPLVGFSLLLVFGFVASDWQTGRKIGQRLLLVFIGILAFLGGSHLFVWSDGLTLHTHAVNENPGYYLAHHNLAEELERRGLWSEELKHREIAYGLSSGGTFVLVPYVHSLVRNRKFDTAMALLDFVQDRDPGNRVIVNLRSHVNSANTHFSEKTEVF